MKKKTKNKILLTTMFSCLGLMLGLTTNKIYSEVKESKAESLHFENVKKASYNDTDKKITLNNEEYKKQYINLNNLLIENETDLFTLLNNSTMSVTLTNLTQYNNFTFDDATTEEEGYINIQYYYESSELMIKFNKRYDNKFVLYNGEDSEIENVSYLEWVIPNQTFYLDVKEAIQKDLISSNPLAVKFSKDQFNENIYKTLNKTLYDNYDSMSMSSSKFYAVTNSLTYQFNCDETYTDEVQYFKVSYEAIVNTHSYEIEFNYQIGNDNKFHLVKDNIETTEIESEQVLNYYLLLTTENDYELVTNAVAVDNQANMGSSIIGAVTTGLGLIGNLANEFLTGFSTLFWDATNSQLTNFGLFSMIFLGIAVTMAVIKLVLAILRSNTGV